MDNLKYEDYLNAVKTKFRLPEVPFELELTEVSENKTTNRQEIFSLFFCGALDKFLEQQLYLIYHEELGEGELFLVPIAKDTEGYKYEAAFNRLID